MSNNEDRFDAEVERICDIYRRVFPDREVTLGFYEGKNPAFGHPHIHHDNAARTFVPETFRADFRSSVVLPGTGKDPRPVAVGVSVPRLPTETELSDTASEWMPRSKALRGLYAISPLRYEQLRHALEVKRKREMPHKHRFSVMPLGRRPDRIDMTDMADVAETRRPAVLIGFHWLEVGGAEKLAFDTVEWALAAGLRVFVVACVPSVQRLAHKLPDHPDLTFVRLDRYLPGVHWPKYIETLVREENVRLIHIHHCVLLYQALGYLREKVPWVEVIDSTHIIEHSDGGYPRISGVHSNLIDAHHVISHELEAFLRDNFHARGKIRLGRMVERDPDMLLPELTMQAGQKTLKVAFIGRMVYQKRPIVMVESLRRLAEWAAQNNVDFSATVVGDGPMKAAVDKLVRRYGLSDKVDLLPGNADVPALLRESDILLLPSNNEGLALVCYEAVEAGCLPLSTDVGAQSEIVPENLLLPWNPAGTVKRTVEIIDRLWRDQTFLDETSRALQARYRTLAGEPTAKAVLSELYTDVAEGRTVVSRNTQRSDVSAVIVTYNRSQKLAKVLDALAEQTVPFRRIFVVDNASNDYTAEMLTDRAKEMDNLEHLRLEKNIGGAGGFHEGIKAAYKDGAEYIWISDDDAYPEPDAIEKLRDAVVDFEMEQNLSPSFACSRVEWTNGAICEMNVPETVWDWTRFVDGKTTRPLVSSCSFVSVLVPRHAVQHNGLPIADYFIWFDDSEYTKRLSRNYPGIFVPESRVIHDIPDNKGVNYGLINHGNVWKYRYGARNEISYRMRDGGIPSALSFAWKVRADMKNARVPPALRRKIFASLLRGMTFRPRIPEAPKP
ncbi:MAG: hypothetical protein CSA74_05095 [Rhodobacterales bacterium]|nr:MAG: hypothetical protein CSA74_05095 [Rhodobacterales bacterium]